MGTELPTSVDVIIPFQATGSLRLDNLGRLADHWASSYDGLRLHVGWLDEDEPWCKAKALHTALEAAEGEVLVVADADVWVDDPWIWTAVGLVHSGRSPWVVPHKMVYRLDAEHSLKWSPGARGRARQRYERGPYIGVPGGGMFVLRRKDYLRVPMDRRFTGWGGQDIAWAHAADTLLGRHRRLDGRLIHLHHEIHPTKTIRASRSANDDLMRAYARARGRPLAMRRLVNQGMIA